jgi:membrane fusion protein, copper/silver efflux system
MKKSTIALLMLTVATGFFLAGYWYSRHFSATLPEAGRKVLYYVDPMNPGYRSDKPGLAPCGMNLEPVYSSGGQASQGSREGQAAMLPGVLQVKPGMEQLIGVKVETVEKLPWSQTIRMPGKVVPDEDRIFRVTTATDGWVRKIFPPTTDSLVTKDEILATFYAPEFFSGLKAYLYALKTLRQTESSGNESGEQIEQSNSNLENYKISLRNLGMSERQLDEIQRTMKGTDNVEIRAPGAGFILNRNISYGQRFEKGVDLYRIADLARVWILADIYDDTALLTKPGMHMRVYSPHLRKFFNAGLTNVPPKFDPETRTFKLRLAAENPGNLLRPDMFVDVEFKMEMPAAITVPVDAVLDSGLRKTVFVERGKGYYEPIIVETGRTSGYRVEIVKGLRPGERVVVSGNFLLDSESRMKSATAGMSGKLSIDPSCGMLVDEGRSRETGLTSKYRGKSYYFCSGECKGNFDKDPQLFAVKRAPMETRRNDPDSGGHPHD